MPIGEYIDWAKQETADLSASPAATVSGWATKWGDDLRRLVKDHAVYEVASLVVARWEFLGCLYAGYEHKTSNQDQAVGYAEKFLVPINRRYEATHTRLLPNKTVARLLFDMLRNKSLHGFTPAGVYDARHADCIVWSCTASGSSASHLTFFTPKGWTADVSLHVDAETLLVELVESMRAYALHLRANTPAAGQRTPVEKFRVGFWWKLHPKDNDSTQYTTWGTDGP